MTWPPADTFRHRFGYGLTAGLGALATVYFLLFALQGRAFLPWAFFTVALAVTLVAAVGLLLMRAQRQAATDRPSGSASGSAPSPGADGRA